MPAPRKTLLLTGVSGLVGRGFLGVAEDRFLTCALARRPQAGSGVPDQPNSGWIQVDIGNRKALQADLPDAKGGA